MSYFCGRQFNSSLDSIPFDEDHIGALIDAFKTSLTGNPDLFESGFNNFTVWDAMDYVDSADHDYESSDSSGGEDLGFNKAKTWFWESSSARVLCQIQIQDA